MEKGKTDRYGMRNAGIRRYNNIVRRLVSCFRKDDSEPCRLLGDSGRTAGRAECRRSALFTDRSTGCRRKEGLMLFYNYDICRRIYCQSLFFRPGDEKTGTGDPAHPVIAGK